MTRTVFSLLVAIIVMFAVASPASADPDLSAFEATTTTGVQLIQGAALGLDFDVVGGLADVKALGVFDHNGDGLLSDHWVYIYDRVTGTAVVSLFIPAGTGTLIDGFRFVDLPATVMLPDGFMGSIAVDYLPGNADRNGNAHGNLPAPPFPVDPLAQFNGGGVLTNVGIARYGAAGAYPGTPDQVYAPGPANRYHSGSFRYQPNPEPGTLVMLGGVGVAAFIIRRRRRKSASA